tara:strand:+ start:1702 stop:2259 length:558 start_codon:yes stop_codon:yes gene_type:complete
MKIDKDMQLGHTVIDDFLPIAEFAFMSTSINSEMFPWNYTPRKITDDGDESLHNHQFVHSIIGYNGGMPSLVSDHANVLGPILNLIKPTAVLRAKINLTTSSSTPHCFSPHIDEHYGVPTTTAIFYMNTNNGYTSLLPVNTKIYSKANTMLLIRGDKQHLGTTSSDTKTRIVVNINYIGGEINAL